MYLFVAYKRVYRWIGLFWLVVLVGAFVFFVARGGWDWVDGLFTLLGSHIFTLTPLVGWAAGATANFAAGQVAWGIGYLALLLMAGMYFFRVVYLSWPDFTYQDEGPSHATPQVAHGAQVAASPQIFKGTGAKVFFYKHLEEGAKGDIIGIIGWVIFAVLWGLYARNPNINIDGVAILFMMVGVPSNSILAILLPLVFFIALAPMFDRGFMEFSHPYFYLIPDSPGNKLLWASMSRIIYVAVCAVGVIGLGGVISSTAPQLVLGTMLAYIAATFMVLGVRAASIGLFSLTSGAGKKLAATLPVLIFVLVGWIGMMAIFFLQPGGAQLGVALLVFSGWCLVIGGIALLYAVKTLHNVDAPV